MIRQFTKDPPRKTKIIYIAPSKALCSERYRDWSSKLQKVYRKCAEVTGDTEVGEDLGDYDLIVTTPEKWDSVTRKWSDYRSFLSSVALVLVHKLDSLAFI